MMEDRRFERKDIEINKNAIYHSKTSQKRANLRNFFFQRNYNSNIQKLFYWHSLSIKKQKKALANN